jgi:hypothetical protein
MAGNELHFVHFVMTAHRAGVQMDKVEEMTDLIYSRQFW